MKSRLAQSPFPAVVSVLATLGQAVRRARVRRGIVVADMAQRCLVSPATYLKLESGRPTVNLGVLGAALHALGMEDRLARLLESDPQGEAMEERKTPKRGRRPVSDIPGIDS